MLRILISAFVVATPLLLGACSAGEGERCNPLQYSDNGVQGDCDNGFACVYPTAPSCGVAYCCKVDDKGGVADDNPNCQPDPTLDSICMLDLATAPLDSSTPIDGSVAPPIDMTMAD